jgi:hypothetical protein
MNSARAISGLFHPAAAMRGDGFSSCEFTDHLVSLPTAPQAKNPWVYQKMQWDVKAANREKNLNFTRVLYIPVGRRQDRMGVEVPWTTTAMCLLG